MNDSPPRMARNKRPLLPILSVIVFSGILAILSQTGQAHMQIKQTGTIQSGMLEVNGASLFYKSQGSGEPMLLIHGYPLSGELFKNNRDALSKRFRVITMDLRGFGKSVAPTSDAGSIQTYATDAIALLDGLKIQRAVIGGMSMGGPIALEMYRRAPQRFRGLILINTLANPAGTVEKALWGGMGQRASEGGAASLVPELMKDMLMGRTQSRNPALVKHLTSIIVGASVPGDIAGAKALAERPNSLPTLKTIRVPTLILSGGEDTVYPPVFSLKMQQGIAGSQLVVIPGASHAAIIEAAPMANRAILSWASKKLGSKQ
jgi:pimeloyl-ACP methyl ester carboxylesterase